MIERALCDAEHIGHLDATQPARVRATVSPRMKRQVLARDHYRCTAPGCCSARNIEAHHIAWKHGARTHKLANLTSLCDACHAMLHAGVLSITGTAPDKLKFEYHVPINSNVEPRPARIHHAKLAPRVGEDAVPCPEVVADARAALLGLGFRPERGAVGVIASSTARG